MSFSSEVMINTNALKQTQLYSKFTGGKSLSRGCLHFTNLPIEISFKSYIFIVARI